METYKLKKKLLNVSKSWFFRCVHIEIYSLKSHGCNVQGHLTSSTENEVMYLDRRGD